MYGLTNTSSRPTTPRGFLRMASPLLRKRRAPLRSADVERYDSNRLKRTSMRL